MKNFWIFFTLLAHDAKQEDGTDEDRNISKLSYSTNDLSNITHNDVNFTQDLKEPINTNGKINTNSEINENTDNTEEKNNPSTVVQFDDSNHQDISVKLHSNTPNFNGKCDFFVFELDLFFKSQKKANHISYGSFSLWRRSFTCIINYFSLEEFDIVTFQGKALT